MKSLFLLLTFKSAIDDFLAVIGENGVVLRNLNPPYAVFFVSCAAGRVAPSAGRPKGCAGRFPPSAGRRKTTAEHIPPLAQDDEKYAQDSLRLRRLRVPRIWSRTGFFTFPDKPARNPLRNGLGILIDQDCRHFRQ